MRIISDSGEQVGVLPRNEALARARKMGLDLVLINETSNPPVAKILDYGKFKYDQEKKAKEAQKKQRLMTQETKELRLRPVTDQHDIQIRVNQANSFINNGDKVMFVVRFRGREIQQRDRGFEILNSILEKLPNVVVEKPAMIQGRDVVMLIGPNKQILDRVREQIANKIKQPG